MAKPKPLRPVAKQVSPLKKKTENAGEAPQISENKDVPVKISDANKVVSYQRSQVEEGIKTMKALLANISKEKKELFDSDGEKISLQISGIKLPRVNDSQIIKIALPHSPLPQSRDVCLIVKDLEKGIKPDHEATVQHFRQLLADKGVTQVTQVIPLRELKVEYKQFEAKTQLCQRFDLFLADARIIRLLPQFLGKAFYKRKKLPVQVDLTAKDLKKELTRAVSTVTLPLKHTGSCSAVSLGYTTLTTQQVTDNTITVLDKLKERFPGGWANIRSVHIKCPSTPSLPLYITLKSANELGKVESSKEQNRKRKTVSDELSTVPGATVTVTPFGTVRVKRTADPEWDVDDEGEPVDVENKEDEEEEKENNEVKEKSPKKKKKSKVEVQQEEKVEDSDSEDEIENAELEYMKKVAEEEEQMEKKLGNVVEEEEGSDKEDEVDEEKALADDNEGSDEDHEASDDDEEAADDAAEAVNLVEDEDDESEDDSDEELNMKNQPDFHSEPESEEEAPVKKKKKKEKKKSTKKAKEVQPSGASSKKSQKQKKFIEKKKKEKQPKTKKKQRN